MHANSTDIPGNRLPSVVDSDGAFGRNYNSVNFMFKHELHGHPLFELESLVALTRRMADHREHYWSNGEVVVNNTWSDGTLGRQSLQDTISNIRHNNSIVILKHTEQDRVYAPLLQGVLGAIIGLVGERMRQDVSVGEVLILVSSPGRVTPYHMDSETNFLLQVTGDKWFHIFDHADRSLVTDQEREDFFAISRNAAVYRADRQADCQRYDLLAGHGVHVPPCAPHWVQNRDSVSVALSVNYELKSVARLEKLHKFNHRIRKLGVAPTPPAVSKWRDRLKLVAENVAETIRERRQGAEVKSYGVWTPPAA